MTKENTKQKKEDIPKSREQSPKNLDLEKFQALMMQAHQVDESYKPTERQWDKILDLREKAMDYTFQERTKLHPKDLLKTFVLVFLVICLLGIFTVILWKVPEYTDIVVTALVSVIGGALGGYGVGKSSIKIPILEEDNE